MQISPANSRRVCGDLAFVDPFIIRFDVPDEESPVARVSPGDSHSVIGSIRYSSHRQEFWDLISASTTYPGYLRNRKYWFIFYKIVTELSLSS